MGFSAWICRKEGRMISCKCANEARVRPKPRDIAVTMNNPINSHPGKMCSCGKMFKNNRGLKIHQEKKQMSDTRKQVGSSTPLSSCLTFDYSYVE